jgi:hypothetical protein
MLQEEQTIRKLVQVLRLMLPVLLVSQKAAPHCQALG